MGIDSIQCDMYVDISGEDCALPDSRLAEAARELVAGKLLLAVMSNRETVSDVPACCRQIFLEIVEQGEDAGQYYYLLRKQG